MKDYLFNSRITVSGAPSRKAAMNELQVMLDDYDDMNSDGEMSICIAPLQEPKACRVGLLTGNDDAVAAYMRVRDDEKPDLKTLSEYADTAVVVVLNLKDEQDKYEAMAALDAVGIDCCEICPKHLSRIRKILGND